jgi:hypothetical protein
MTEELKPTPAPTPAPKTKVLDVYMMAEVHLNVDAHVLVEVPADITDAELDSVVPRLAEHCPVWEGADNEPWDGPPDSEPEIRDIPEEVDDDPQLIVSRGPGGQLNVRQAP